MCFDHDPSTHEFRGWICQNCNTAIGKLGDNLAGLMAAVDYLSKCPQLNPKQTSQKRHLNPVPNTSTPTKATAHAHCQKVHANYVEAKANERTKNYYHLYC
ncbi:endonuclease VII [Synechococcus phage S-SRP01]|uniref:Endonuclease VII n=1 Tax=Synechococcus phage S-SRP01 TaxID=2781607 RepID=A0A874MFS2_9CAUD|nr:endonuclease VII [Synechococcus phage S-SRP01]